MRLKTLFIVSLFLCLMSLGSAQTYVDDWNDLNNIRNNLDGDYILSSSLDSNSAGYDSVVNVSNGFSSIGSSSSPFTGTFKSYEGETISDFYGKEIFGYIENAEINNVEFNASNYVAEGSGTSLLLGGVNNSLVKDITITNIDISSVGGLIASDSWSSEYNNIVLKGSNYDVGDTGILSNSINDGGNSFDDIKVDIDVVLMGNGGLIKGGDFGIEYNISVSNVVMKGKEFWCAGGGIFDQVSFFSVTDGSVNVSNIYFNYSETLDFSDRTGSGEMGIIAGTFEYDGTGGVLNISDVYIESDSTLTSRSCCYNDFGVIGVIDSYNSGSSGVIDINNVISNIGIDISSSYGEWENVGFLIGRGTANGLDIDADNVVSISKTDINNGEWFIQGDDSYGFNSISVSDSYYNSGLNSGSSSYFNSAGTSDMIYPYSSTVYEGYNFTNVWYGGDHSIVTDLNGNTGYPYLQDLRDSPFKIISESPKNSSFYELVNTSIVTDIQTGDSYDCVTVNSYVYKNKEIYNILSYPETCGDVVSFNKSFSPSKFGDYVYNTFVHGKESPTSYTKLYESEDYTISYKYLSPATISILNPSDGGEYTSTTQNLRGYINSVAEGDVFIYSNGVKVFSGNYSNLENSESYNVTESVGGSLQYGVNNMTMSFKRDEDGKIFNETINYRIYIGPNVVFKNFYPSDESIISVDQYSSVNIDSNVEGDVSFYLDGSERSIQGDNHHYGDGERTYYVDLSDLSSGVYCYYYEFEGSDISKKSDDRCFTVMEDNETVVTDFNYLKPEIGSELIRNYNTFGVELYTNVAGRLSLYIDGVKVDQESAEIFVDSKNERINYTMDIYLNNYTVGKYDYEFKFSYLNETTGSKVTDFNISGAIGDIYNLYPSDGSDIMVDRRDESLTHKWSIEQVVGLYKEYPDYHISVTEAYVNDVKVFEDRVLDLDADFKVDVPRLNLSEGSNSFEVVYEFRDINGSVLDSVSKTSNYKISKEATWYERIGDSIEFEGVPDSLKLLIASFFIISVGITGGIMVGVTFGVGALIFMTFVFMEIGFLPTWLFVVTSITIGAFAYVMLK